MNDYTAADIDAMTPEELTRWLDAQKHRQFIEAVQMWAFALLVVAPLLYIVPAFLWLAAIGGDWSAFVRAVWPF